MSRTANIGLGIVLIGIGLMITAASYSSTSGGGKYYVMTGLIVVGFIRIIRGLTQRDAPPPEFADQEVGRDGPSRGPQVVGKACASCGSKIISVAEATSCAGCGQPVHHDCEQAHRKEAHARPRPAA